MAVYRVLKDIAYQTSYTHGGRYYALKERMEFDQHGLWSARSVWFSTDGTPRFDDASSQSEPRTSGGWLNHS